MPILERATAAPSLSAIREIRAEMACERQPEFERFYVGLLGLAPWPEAEQTPGAWGVGPTRRGLLFQHRHDPRIDPARRRFVLLVPDLNQMAERLRLAEWPHDRLHGLFSSEDCLALSDPCGNRIEVRQSRCL
jgi:hypothetical protein